MRMRKAQRYRETEKEECAWGMGWGKRERGEREEIHGERQKETYRERHTERGRNKNRETKIRTKRRETEKKDRDGVK